MTTISVVIPTLDDARHLERCLLALAKQTRPADEVIVVDNGSVDDSAEVARRFHCRLVHEAVRGIPAATARGFDSATKDILARLDADSVPAENWVERVVEHFERDKRLTAVTGTGKFYGSRRWVHRAGEVFYLGGYFWYFTLLLGHSPVFGSNFAIRRSAWIRLEPRFVRHKRNVHDDMHLSILIEPDMTVLFDEDLRVGVSARPFEKVSRVARGAWRAVPTARESLDRETFRRRRARRRAWQSNGRQT